MILGFLPGAVLGTAVNSTLSPLLTGIGGASPGAGTTLSAISSPRKAIATNYREYYN